MFLRPFSILGKRKNRRTSMYSHRESNPDQRFRKPTFYPLNYGSNEPAGHETDTAKVTL